MKLCTAVVLAALVACAAGHHVSGREHAIVNKADVSPRGPGFTRVYSDYGQAGYYYDFTEYVPDLASYEFDNTINSACQTGLWFYYEQVEYNQQPGSVYWMHGIEFCGDLPSEYADTTSSIRYAGSPFALNGDSFTLYQGDFFTGNEFWGDTDYPGVSYMDDDCSSLVVTGLSPWTFYSEVDYLGFSMCVYPNTDHDVGSDGSVIDFGIFATMGDLGYPDNSISSVLKGCFSKNIATPATLKALHRASHGAMGVLNAGH